VIPWIKLMHEEIKKIREGDSEINPYAGTSDIEFFSVVSEYFFKQPTQLERDHPALFNILNEIFQVETYKKG
jgi:Mlc titration factor MtfA (ptsG expression regulator)